MFTRLKLKNFRKVRDGEMRFQSGIVAIRGANESSKSTRLSAIAYAMGGARALNEKLSEVVTWGEKESSLRVELEACINGVTYVTTRSKAGAEIADVEGKVLATGQTEVTSYWEKLLQASMPTISNLMMANQGSLRGALSEGGQATNALIERLSNFSIIDEIISLVQEKLPTGNTTAAKARIETLEQATTAPIESNVTVVRQAVTEAEARWKMAATLYNQRKADYDVLQAPASAAEELEAARARAGEESERAAAALKVAQAVLDKIVVGEPPNADLVALRRAVEDKTLRNRATVAVSGWQKLVDSLPAFTWDGDMVSLQAEHAKYMALAVQTTAELRTVEIALSRDKALLITETACGLCGKDLRSVPEVVAKNYDTQNRIDANLAAIQSANNILAEANGGAADCAAVIDAGRKVRSFYDRNAEFFSIDEANVPPTLAWTGPDLAAPFSGDPEGDLRRAEQAQAMYQQALGRKEQAETALRAVQAKVYDCATHLKTAQQACIDARIEETLCAAAEATAALNAVQEAYVSAQGDLHQAQQELRSEESVVAERRRSRAALESQLQAAQKELESTVFNNDLIKTLREARPEIAAELWNAVSVTISHYFSTIRGVPSVFSRDGDEFKVDGRSIVGLSGSTLDALGLAMRMGLTKTFLPNSSFMVLDEASAACDGERTITMAGVVASADFQQVLWVTHDESIAQFANQVIQIN